jgi:hypothetical protein
VGMGVLTLLTSMLFISPELYCKIEYKGLISKLLKMIYYHLKSNTKCYKMLQNVTFQAELDVTKSASYSGLHIQLPASVKHWYVLVIST